MALMAAAAAIPTLIQGASSLSHPKDPERFAANATAFARARQGDSAALAFLKQRTGEYGIAFVAGYGEVGGWASGAAKADAKAKYTAALAFQAGGQAVAQVGEMANEQLNQAGYQIVPKAQPWQLYAIGAAVAFLVWRAYKGGR